MENSDYDPAKNESFYSTFDRFVDSRIITKTRRQHFVCLRDLYEDRQKKVNYGVNIHGFNIDDFTEFKFYLEWIIKPNRSLKMFERKGHKG